MQLPFPPRRCPWSFQPETSFPSSALPEHIVNFTVIPFHTIIVLVHTFLFLSALQHYLAHTKFLIFFEWINLPKSLRFNFTLTKRHIKVPISIRLTYWPKGNCRVVSAKEEYSLLFYYLTNFNGVTQIKSWLFSKKVCFWDMFACSIFTVPSQHEISMETDHTHWRRKELNCVWTAFCYLHGAICAKYLSAQGNCNLKLPR